MIFPPIGLFLGFFGLYVHTAAPYTAAYRDAGEMVSILSTLGVAHPPGYPLYTILGRLAALVPFGNLAFRANLFSGACGAAAVGMIYLVLRKWLSPIAASIGAGFYGLSIPFWELANVSEMYALGVLWLTLLLYVAFVREDAALWSFLMALGLGVRMDMLLLIPIFLFYFWRSNKLAPPLLMAGAFAAGLSVFLYLPIRSLRDPVVDWGNPDSLIGLFNSMTRRSYSGTLDLLSLSYERGENFPDNARFYGLHLLKAFGWIGVAGIAYGASRLRSIDKRAGIFLLAAFAVSGPLFLYLANMPLNPHAAAIVEAAFPIPDLLLVLPLGFALDAFRSKRIHPAIVALALVGLVWNGAHAYARASKRGQMYARDYVENILRSAPSGSAIAMHKDVQLFSLWEAQLAERKRLDLSLVATGLSASPWYWDMRKRWGTPEVPHDSLKDAAGWTAMRRDLGARRFFAGFETDIDPGVKLPSRPHGLLLEVGPADAPYEGEGGRVLNELCLYRGRYVYGETPDFFTSDLVGDHARAADREGFEALLHNRNDIAEYFFRRAEGLDPTFPRPSVNRGYMLLMANRLEPAYDAYRSGIAKFQQMLKDAAAYKSLPDVVNAIKMDLSSAYTNMGAVEERLGRREAARDFYQASYEAAPNAQAHFNMAVTYWGRDWSKVIEHMTIALELNPGWDEARKQLSAATIMNERAKEAEAIKPARH
jgi:hypothetical protein